ncbi:MAG: polysaccharide pyruvyl transferase CsaB [Synechococcaceae bacterium WB9_2_112]|nr:polysaccharide pyruvyl transferase CsaB [Synechococcaceae bacterium WB9_2_112]
MASLLRAQHAAGQPLLLCGYYGEHNLGDDALLEVLLAQIAPGTAVVITAYDEQLVQQRHGFATVQRRHLTTVLAALRHCRALVLGGGSLLQDATSFKSLLYYAALITVARGQGKPVVLWGQGLGPLHRRRSRWLVRFLLPLATAVCWRDPASAALAASLGRVDPAAADPVWASQPVPWLGLGGPIVVCLRPTALLGATAWRVYLEALAALAQAADREVLWLPFHQDQDQTLLADLQQAGLLPEALRSRSRQVQARTPAEAKAVFASAGLVIAMRLHGLILAAVSGAPTAALSYDPKVEAAAQALGCPCHSLQAPARTDELLLNWQRQLDHPAPPRVSETLRRQAAQLAALLNV